MRVYHRTNAAQTILQRGFRDGKGCYLTDSIHTGVWVSDVPLDENEGACGDSLITLEIPEELFAQHEWIEEFKTYREALIPAKLLNRYLQSASLEVGE